MISFGRHICNDFNVAIEKEWLLTNRKGSYSSSTILLTNTRKYHGLLVAKLPGMDNRVVIFPNCDEEVSMSGHIHNISTHKYRETVYPKGYSYLENFSVKNDIVEFLFLVENMRLKKEIFLMKESNSLVITYTVLTPNSHASITVKPFIAFREAEHLVKEIPVFFPEITVISERKLRISAYSNFPPGYIYIPEGSEAKMEGVWYRDFYYLREAQSGYDASEDLYNAGIIKFDIEYNKPRIMVFSLEDFPEEKVTGLRDEYDRQFKRVDEICEEKGVCIRQDESRNNIRHLIAAAESFEIRADDGSVFVAAGYMWPHLMWYRDALASLPGIFLVLKKYAEAKELLITGLSMAGKGLIPLSVSMDKKNVRYSSADTTLWFFFALQKYLEASGDYKLVEKNSDFFRKLTLLIDDYCRGSDYNIHIDSDDLIYAGLPNIPVTWMDTVLNGTPVTPRNGKAVEVNALWYNAVKVMEYICAKNGEKELEKSYSALAARVKDSFNRRFWNEEAGCPFDCVDAPGNDASIRPNQVLSISLPFSVIDDPKRREMIMNTVIKELYTSFGLRTLSNMSTSFKAAYVGDQASRDRAIHQGTVWAWTAGHFVTAYLKTYGRSPESLNFIETVYEPFFEHLKTAGLGTVSEMFDGSFPYNAKGRISHAWAVAELLRSYFEDYIGGNGKTK